MRANTIVTKILELSHDNPELLLRTGELSATRLRSCSPTSLVLRRSLRNLAMWPGWPWCIDATIFCRKSWRSTTAGCSKTSGMQSWRCSRAVRRGWRLPSKCSLVWQPPICSILRTRQVRVRIGLHYGSGIVKSNDVFGDVVNTASRVESVAGPERIVISDCLHRELPKDKYDVVLLGQFRLKGKSCERELYEVRWNKQLTTTMSQTHMLATAARSH